MSRLNTCSRWAAHERSQVRIPSCLICFHGDSIYFRCSLPLLDSNHASHNRQKIQLSFNLFHFISFQDDQDNQRMNFVSIRSIYFLNYDNRMNNSDIAPGWHNVSQNASTISIKAYN